MIQSPRQQARDRQRKRRELMKEAARVAAIADAERRELVNEFLAPSVSRAPVMVPERRRPSSRRYVEGHGVIWVDGEVIAPARVLKGPRLEIVAGQVERAMPPDLSSLTPDHLRAARRLQADWDAVGTGVGVPAVDWLRVGGGSARRVDPPGHAALLAQTQTRASLEAALAHLGAFTPMVAHVILDCVPLGQWAARAGHEMPAAVTLMRGALQRLHVFYWPEPRALMARIRTIGPGRAAYEVGCLISDNLAF